MDFSHTVCVVTGAASGLGRGIAQRLLDRGATVIPVDVDERRLREFARDNAAQGDRIEPSVVDVTDYDAVHACLDAVFARHGRIDYLFNNAGVGGTLPFAEASIKHWRKIIDLNLFGVIHGMTAVYPFMLKQNYGHIVNTSSISGLIPFAGQTLYNTTKYAITGLSLSLRPEAKKNNISVSIICPGMVKTRIFYKPIIGAEAREENVVIPKEAISVEKAVDDIFEGLRKKRGIIITPGFLNGLFLRYRLSMKTP